MLPRTREPSARTISSHSGILRPNYYLALGNPYTKFLPHTQEPSTQTTSSHLRTLRPIFYLALGNPQTELLPRTLGTSNKLLRGSALRIFYYAIIKYPCYFIQGLSLSTQGTRVFRGSDLGVDDWCFIRKLMTFSLKSEYWFLGNQNLSKFRSQGFRFQFYQKSCEMFSEVRVSGLRELDTFRVSVSGLFI